MTTTPSDERLKMYWISIKTNPDRDYRRAPNDFHKRDRKCEECHNLVLPNKGWWWHPPGGPERWIAIHDQCLPEMTGEQARAAAKGKPDWEHICRYIPKDDPTPPPAHLPQVSRNHNAWRCQSCRRYMRSGDGWRWRDPATHKWITMHRDCAPPSPIWWRVRASRRLALAMIRLARWPWDTQEEFPLRYPPRSRARIHWEAALSRMRAGHRLLLAPVQGRTVRA